MKYGYLSKGYFKPIKSQSYDVQETRDERLRKNILNANIANRIENIKKLLTPPEDVDRWAFIELINKEGSKFVYKWLEGWSSESRYAHHMTFLQFVQYCLFTNDGISLYPYTGEPVEENHKMHQTSDPDYIQPILHRPFIEDCSTITGETLIDFKKIPTNSTGISSKGCIHPIFTVDIFSLDTPDIFVEFDVANIKFNKSEIRVRSNFKISTDIAKVFTYNMIKPEFIRFAKKKNYGFLRELLLDYRDAIKNMNYSDFPDTLDFCKKFHESTEKSLSYLKAVAEWPGMDQVKASNFIDDLENMRKRHVQSQSIHSNTFFPVAKEFMGDSVTNPNSRFVQTKKLLEEQLSVPVYLDIDLCNGKEIITI